MPVRSPKLPEIYNTIKLFGIGGAIQEILDSEPIAYWPFQEISGSTALAYNSAGLVPALNATIVSTTIGQPASRGIGLAYLHDKINDYEQLPASAIDSVINWSEGTMMAFLNPAGLITSGRVMTLGVDASNGYQIYQNNNTFIHRFEGTDVAISLVKNPITVGWHTTAFTWQASGLADYWDGEPNLTSGTLPAFVGNLTQNTTLIGAFQSPNTLLFDGGIAHVALWDRALSPTEIASISRYRGVS